MSSKLLRAADIGRLDPIPWNQACAPAGLAVPLENYIARQQPESAGPVEQRVAALEVEAERRAREAYQAGYREGETTGRKKGLAEVEPVLQKLASTIHQVSEVPQRLRLEAEADMVRLAVTIARRILNRELSCDSEAITGLVRIAFEKLRLQETVRVCAHPSHQKTLQHALERAGGSHVEVAADPSLDCGSVVFETTRGKLDVSAETQLREIERGLTDRLRAAGA